MAIIIPIVRDKIIRNLKVLGIINSWLGEYTHKYKTPKITEKTAILMVGFSIGEFEIVMSGLDFIINLEARLIKRNEYRDVIEMDNTIIIEIIIVKFDEIIFSIIESFEKNPDIKGIPIRDKFEIPIIVIGIGEL